MTILSDAEILECLCSGELRIDPFSDKSLSPAGYDLRNGASTAIDVGKQSLLHTMERLEIGPSICGQIYIRSSFAREGLVGSFAFIDPGFKGQLTLAFINMGISRVEIAEGERIAQVVFNKMGSSSSKPYSGRYQNSTGTVSSKRNF
ncbi:MAG: dCTP deaminase [Candidatus Methanomethylicaceae archaeon]|jgi:dCTP deaminase